MAGRNNKYNKADYTESAYDETDEYYDEDSYEDGSGQYREPDEYYEDEYYEDGGEDPYSEDGYSGEGSYSEGSDGFEAEYEDQDEFGDEFIEEYDDDEDPSDDDRRRKRRPYRDSRRPWWTILLNTHVIFLVLAAVIIGLIVLRFSKWGKHIDVDEFFKEHELITGGEDTFDVFLPLMDEDGNLLANKAPHSIVFFGNSVFADDRDSENNVVNMIAKQTGSTVYNCSVGGSYLASQKYVVKENTSGLDAYNFYFLTFYLAWQDKPDFFDWLESNPDANILPETRELRQTLDSIDMSTVDTIAILYDGSDYLAGNNFYNPENPTDITTFCGNLAAGLDVLQSTFPDVRIIVLSPTYAFGIDDNGEYISSDIKRYGKGESLSTFVLKECETAVTHNATFVDNIYGTFNEDEAPDYLTDNLHLNQAGREKLVKRFIRALTYYDNK